MVNRQIKSVNVRETKTCQPVWCFSKYLAHGQAHDRCLRDTMIRAVDGRVFLQFKI